MQLARKRKKKQSIKKLGYFRLEDQMKCFRSLVQDAFLVTHLNTRDEGLSYSPLPQVSSYPKIPVPSAFLRAVVTGALGDSTLYCSLPQLLCFLFFSLSLSHIHTSLCLLKP